MQPLLDLLKTGFYHLKTEEAQLKSRADEKAASGTVARKKVSGKQKQFYQKSKPNSSHTFSTQVEAEPPIPLILTTSVVLCLYPPNLSGLTVHLIQVLPCCLDQNKAFVPWPPG